MNTDNDYLWDKTGQPDPEIQQLEEVLSTLRYQPRPLEIPDGLQVGRKRNFFRSYGPRLAIAATLAMLLVGLGVWFGLQKMQRTQPTQVVKAPGNPAVSSEPPPPAPAAPDQNKNPELASSSSGSDGRRTELPRRRRANTGSSRVLNEAAKEQLARDAREGEAAKNQLMLALRLASAKLNFAQKKTQGTNQRDSIHNQHKIG